MYIARGEHILCLGDQKPAHFFVLRSLRQGGECSIYLALPSLLRGSLAQKTALSESILIRIQHMRKWTFVKYSRRTATNQHFVRRMIRMYRAKQPLVRYIIERHCPLSLAAYWSVSHVCRLAGLPFHKYVNYVIGRY